MDKILDYIKSKSPWEEGLRELRTIILNTELKETLKWGMPVYTLDKKNVVGIGAFKSYFGLWFYQGVFLKDEFGFLMNAQEGKTKAMRQWRFSSVEELEANKAVVLAYIIEAIENQKQGKVVKIERKKEFDIPIELKTILDEREDLKSAFEGFSFGDKKDFCEYISSAKRAATKTRRLDKIVPMILRGEALMDKYR